MQAGTEMSVCRLSKERLKFIPDFCDSIAQDFCDSIA